MAEYIEREAFLSDTTQRYCINCDSYNGVRCRACWVNDMQGEVDDFPAADVAPVVRWISVEDRLPPPYVDVLAYRKNFSREGGFATLEHLILWHDKTLVWNNDTTTWRSKVTHWMPLPEPPQLRSRHER